MALNKAIQKQEADNKAKEAAQAILDEFLKGVPDIPAERIKGVRTGYQGLGKWIREFKEWDVAHYIRYGITPELLGQSSDPVLEEGEELYMMVGEFVDDPRNTDQADHRIVGNGYISIVAHNVDCTDYQELTCSGCLCRMPRRFCFWRYGVRCYTACGRGV